MYFCILNVLAGLGLTNGLPEIVKIGEFQKQLTLATDSHVNDKMIRSPKKYWYYRDISGGLFDESDQSESKQETAFR